MCGTGRHGCLRHSTSPRASSSAHATTATLDRVSRLLKQIDCAVPDGLDVHIVMDNYATHKTAKVRAWLARRPHYHVHFTPTSASWINQVERGFAELTGKHLQRGVHRSTGQLETDILTSVKRFCQKTDQTLCGELKIHMTSDNFYRYSNNYLALQMRDNC